LSLLFRRILRCLPGASWFHSHRPLLVYTRTPSIRCFVDHGWIIALLSSWWWVVMVDDVVMHSTALDITCLSFVLSMKFLFVDDEMAKMMCEALSLLGATILVFCRHPASECPCPCPCPCSFRPFSCFHAATIVLLYCGKLHLCLLVTLSSIALPVSFSVSP